MKKIAIILVALLILTSCSKNRIIDFLDEIGDVRILTGAENGIFKNEFISSEIETVEESIADPQKTTISIGDCEFDVYPLSVQHSSIGVINKYKDEKCLYQMTENGDFFLIQAQSGFALEEFLYEELNEEALDRHINDFILKILPNENLEKYTASTQTRIIVQNPDSAWSEKLDRFYRADEKNNESVICYTRDFKQFSQNIPTSNSITVMCDSKGNITWIEYHNSDADWNSVTIDIEDIHRRALSYLTNAISEEYEFSKCVFVSESLDYTESTVRVVVNCEVTLLHNGSEVVTMCSLSMGT